MEDAHAFLRTLAIVLGVAAVTTILFHRLKQPVVLGYIIAGLLVGPHLPLPLDADIKTVQTLSELGVILLMFGIGLELEVAKLLRVGPTAGVIGVIQVAVMICAGILAGDAFGWTRVEGIFAGAAIAISSTTIIAKVFEETKVSDRIRELVYGVLIVEDIIAIILLATMTPIATGAGLDAKTLAVTTGKLLLFLVAMVLVGWLLVPRVMGLVAKVGRRETTVVASIGVCFVFAHACAAMHYSVALGAFVAGVLIAESGYGHDVEHAIVSVRDMFAAIFFVSVGMLIDPRLVLENWLPVLVLSAVVVAGKMVGVSLGGIVTGCGLRTSVQAGLSLSQIGEFSFIIVGLGTTLGATRPFLFPVAVAVSAITTLTTPSLIQRSAKIAQLVEDKSPKTITSFVALYSAWLDKVRAAPPSSSTTARLRRLVVLLVLDTAAVCGIIVGSAVLHDRITATLADRFMLGATRSEMLLLALAGVVALPFLFGVVRLSRAIALTIASGDSPAARAVALVIQLGLVSAAFAVAIATVEPFVPPGIGVGMLFVLGLVATWAFWRYARRFDVEARAGGAAVLEALKAKLAVDAKPHREHTAASHQEPSESVLSGLGAPTLLTLEPGSPAVGSSLSELDLRSKTGAAVLALVRNGQVTMLPSANMKLEAGDTLAVVGPDTAIKAARELLLAAEDDAAASPIASGAA